MTVKTTKVPLDSDDLEILVSHYRNQAAGAWSEAHDPVAAAFYKQKQLKRRK